MKVYGHSYFVFVAARKHFQSAFSIISHELSIIPSNVSRVFIVCFMMGVRWTEEIIKLWHVFIDLQWIAS
jgi:hypothetical protein